MPSNTYARGRRPRVRRGRLSPTVKSLLTPAERRLLDDVKAGRFSHVSKHTPEELADNDTPACTVRGAFLRELMLGRHGEPDPRGIRLRGARISGELDLSYINTTTGLFLVSCYLDQEIQLRDTHLPRLVLRWTAIPTLFGDGLHMDGSVFLDKGFTATARDRDAAVRLNNAHIRGTLNLAGAQLANQHGAALEASGIRVDGDLVLNDGFAACADSEHGAFCISHAQLGGQLLASGARLTNLSGPALHADGLCVDDGVFLDGGFTAEGNGDNGAVRLLGAQIRGSLHLDCAQLANPKGPAIGADRLQLDGNLTLNGGFTATGGGRGTIRLINARIAGQFTALGARLTNHAGPALDAQGLRLAGDLFMQEGFIATGTGSDATVRLSSADVGGQLGLLGAELINSNGPILDLSDANAGTVFSPSTLLCPHEGTTTKSCAAEQRRIRMDGFTYAALRRLDWRHWLHVIRRHTSGYRPQPYQHLAAVQKAAGHDGDTRRVLIAQQEDFRARGQLGGSVATAVHWMWGRLAGYGYRPARLAVALLLVLALAGGLGWLAGRTTTALATMPLSTRQPPPTLARLAPTWS